MIIPFNAAVVCVDGAGGSITSVVIRRLGLQVKELVVREKRFPFTDHLVPLGWLLNTSSHQLMLRCTRDELAALEPTGEAEGSLVAVQWYRSASWEYGVWPFPPAVILNQQSRSPLAAGDLILSESTQLKAFDGHIGHACGLNVDPSTCCITQVIFQDGHFWHQKRMTIPASAIIDVTEETIAVSLNRHSIDALSVHRPATFSPLHRW